MKFHRAPLRDTLGGATLQRPLSSPKGGLSFDQHNPQTANVRRSNDLNARGVENWDRKSFFS